MKYKLILYNLKNRMSKLESIIIEYKPTFEFCEQCCELYGVEWFELENAKQAIKTRFNERGKMDSGDSCNE